jgi:hypothetical protein
MKTYGEVNIDMHVFYSLTVVESEWSGSHPGRFTHGTHLIAGVGPRTDLDDMERRKILLLSGLELRLTLLINAVNCAVNMHFFVKRRR